MVDAGQRGSWALMRVMSPAGSAAILHILQRTCIQITNNCLRKTLTILHQPLHNKGLCRWFSSTGFKMGLYHYIVKD
jgi:hypothetical protein